MGAAHSSARSGRSLPRARPGRPTGGEFRPAVEHAGQQRHPASRCAQAWQPKLPAPAIIGIDDWAWRRNQRYGTLICDLERRKTIALLPDREPATAEAWLTNQPQIAVVARDRGVGYALATQRALPNAVQVADRWHLMENASHAFLDAVRKSMRQIRAAIGAATINPALLTAAEKLQYEGYLRREETNAAILAMAKEGATIKEIVRRTGYSRGLARKVLRGQRSDIFRVRSSSLDPYLPWLDEQWIAGRRNGSELWRSLRRQNSTCSKRASSAPRMPSPKVRQTQSSTPIDTCLQASARSVSCGCQRGKAAPLRLIWRRSAPEGG